MFEMPRAVFLAIVGIMLIRFYRSNFWLRDNCRCTECVNQDTMQKNFDTFSIPHDVRPVAAGIEGDNLVVTSSSQVQWTAPDVQDNPPTVPFDEVMNPDSEEGIAKLTRLIQIYGFAFVSNTPVSPDETKVLLEHIGPIRNTHYGGFYDFIPDLALADTAYTNLALPAHTDTTYFTEPAGLQAFHLLSHHPPPSAQSGAVAEGGKSLLVDGFKAAYILRKEDPHAFEILRKQAIPWHASGNKGIAIRPSQNFPVLETAPWRVRWNNDDRGVVPFGGESQDADLGNQELWYAAARKWNEIIKRKEMEYWVQLTPGNVLIFNNWRVLHGRSAFEGVRRICGGYINNDDFISRYRNTNFSREEVLRQVIG
ncbi:trimethyllysine dioxygenase [Pyricularia oryzae Y34]|uniref:trimethyllysine dioxygenase n=2 Tax=Pyricularia oryzae TaxID=318829 RepID=A0AA97PKK0_PYRO3|nr:trimethyllysine dioxygenase [Pyricularia oryzae Y34]